MRKTLEYILKIFAKIVIWRYRPAIVAVTGSAGKTGTKEAIYHVLKKRFKVRRNIKNYNNEVGVPLTVLGSYVSPSTNFKGLWGWFKIFTRSVLTIIYQPNYPEILVLEMGIAKPGDMEYLMSFIPIKVGVFTSIGQFPVHMKHFPGKSSLVGEKAKLVESVPKDGLAVLNYDDPSIKESGEKLSDKIKKMYFGFDDGADLNISNYELTVGDLNKKDFGVNFKLEHEGSTVPVRLIRVMGRHQASITASAAAVGLYFGLNLVQISGALRKYRTIAGRTRLLKGIKKTWLIDDSYNASPLSVLGALDILKNFPCEGRRIAALGDMLELGENMEEGHRQVGKKAAEVANILFAVGERSIFMAEEARKQGMENVFEFSQSEDAAIPVQEEIQEGDLVLIKGSRGIRMEKVTKEIMLHPEKAGKLLV